jgi:hypothetical protein
MSADANHVHKLTAVKLSISVKANVRAANVMPELKQAAHFMQGLAV